MKQFKSLIALVLAVMMVIALCGTVLADDTPTGSITIQGNSTVDVSNKTFKAYKILDATYDNANHIAYTVPAGLHNFYNTYAPFQNGNNDVEAQATAANKTFDRMVYEKIAALTSSADIQAFVSAALTAAKASGSGVTPVTSVGAVMSGLPAGYYIVEDQATQAPISSLMLDTVTNGNVTIKIKVSVPTPDKKIKTAGELVNEKANEVGIGRTVNYEVTEHVPNWAGYDRYYYIIDDTLSSGLTFNNDIVVKVGDATLTAGTDYYVYTGADAIGNDNVQKTFQIAFANIKNYTPDTTITVTYSANVNMNAITGVNPNTNKVEIEYSNNPSKSGTPDSENKPGKPNNTTDNPTGMGPASWTDTYTTKITVTKRDATNNNAPLPGVEFTLTGTSQSVVVKTKEIFHVDATNGTYYMLTDGTYTTQAPRTEATLEATTGDSGWVQDDNYDGADAREVGGHKYRPYRATDGDTVHYTIVEPNDASYVSTTIKYSKTTATDTLVDSYPVTMVGTTNNNGVLVFEKLGAGSYTLDETGVLPGYNDITNVTFTITCTLPDEVTTGTEKATWTVSNVSNGSFTQDGGNFAITIDNYSGAELPSTGGIGTTIFYVAGIVLVLGAAAIIIARRKAEQE